MTALVKQELEQRWNSDDVRSLVEPYDDSLRGNCTQLFGCYGVGLIGNEKDGMVSLYVCWQDTRPKPIPAYWNRIVRVNFEKFNESAHPLLVAALSDLATELIKFKYNGWKIEFAREQTLDKMRRSALSLSLKITNPQTGQVLYRASQRLYNKKRCLNKINAVVQQLRKISATTVEDVLVPKSRFVGLHQPTPTVAMLLTMHPQITAEQLLQLSRQAENLEGDTMVHLNRLLEAVNPS